jgi:hypothetical protein
MFLSRGSDAQTRSTKLTVRDDKGGGDTDFPVHFKSAVLSFLALVRRSVLCVHKVGEELSEMPGLSANPELKASSEAWLALPGAQHHAQRLECSHLEADQKC